MIFEWLVEVCLDDNDRFEIIFLEYSEYIVFVMSSL